MEGSIQCIGVKNPVFKMLLFKFHIEMFERGAEVGGCSLLLSVAKLLHFQDTVSSGLTQQSHLYSVLCGLAWIYPGKEEDQHYRGKDSSSLEMNEVTYSRQLVLYSQSPCAQPFQPESAMLCSTPLTTPAPLPPRNHTGKWC